jgi:uncharacterized Zn finger protein
MPRESRRAKALRYLAEERVTVTSANEHGIRLEVRGSAKEPYRVAYGTDASGRLVTECTCANTEAHPIRPTCSHVEICKLLRRV